MRKLIYLFFLCGLFTTNINAQYHTSLTDIYMGNYGFWDYQSAGSLEALEQDYANTGRFHSVYLSADSGFGASKRVLYFYSSNNGSTWVSAVVSNQATYPSLALQSDGNAIICFLDTASASSSLFRPLSPGALTFSQMTSPPSSNATNPKIIYYRNYLVLIALFPGGSLQRIRYSYLSSSWGTWQQIAAGVGSAYQAAKGWDG